MEISTDRVRVGVIGCGLIAQVMHLPHLVDLADRFELTAVCDLAEDLSQACAARFGARAAYTDWRRLVTDDLDAVLILTSGSHAPVAVAAADAGRHVFVEKPMCFSVQEGLQMVEAADRARRVLMVGYNKRHDLAYQRLAGELQGQADIRFARVTTFESPIPPYVAQYPLLQGAALPSSRLDALRADSDARLRAAVPRADEPSRWMYGAILLDTLVHEVNSIRGLLGEPDRLVFADMRKTDVTVVLEFGDIRCVITWIDLPGIARYAMEFGFYSPDRRWTLTFPSPFLRNEPAILMKESGESGSPAASVSEEVTSYESSFKRELVHFHECIVSGREPLTSGRDGLRDIALCRAVVEAHSRRTDVSTPTAIPTLAPTP